MIDQGYLPEVAPLFIIGGPTGSGKTALAERICDQLPCNLISADSIQIYKHFDIGSAKPDSHSLKNYPYFLIDFQEPHKNFSAFDFTQKALAIIQSSWRDKKIPILVGGTGFYIRSLLLGLSEIPPIPEDLRDLLRSHHQTDAIHKIELTLKAIYKSLNLPWTILPGDSYRLSRAWEVLLATGIPYPQFRKTSRGLFQHFRIDLHYLYIDLPRESLWQRIEMRTKSMIEKGLIEETKDLLLRGIPSDCVPMRSLGYKETLLFLKEKIRTVSELKDTIVLSTRQFSKRQRTWFRAEPAIPMSSHEQIEIYITRLIEKFKHYHETPQETLDREQRKKK